MSRPPVNGKNVKSTGALLSLLVERSAPDLTRPRISPEREARLAEVEAKSAACYAQSELLTVQMQRLAIAIDDWDTESDEDITCAPVVMEYEGDDDSVVIHLNQLRVATKID